MNAHKKTMLYLLFPTNLNVKITPAITILMNTRGNFHLMKWKQLSN